VEGKRRKERRREGMKQANKNRGIKKKEEGKQMNTDTHTHSL
jgi:hypothetical protein